MKRKYIFVLIFSLILLTLVEIPSYFILKKIFVPRGLVYTPIQSNLEDYNNYKKKRHPILGWTVAKNQEKEIDSEGSRIIPSFASAEKHTSCVSLYGDSYTFSNRTTPEDSWANQLSILLGCRVSNFGVSGYGSDQALLRYQLNKKDSASVVFLNHFVDDIPRNVSQYWGIRFSSKTQEYMFKPRFIVKNDTLKQIPLPNLTYEEFEDLKSNPKKYLTYDWFVPNSDYGSSFLQFPYSYTLIKTLFVHSKFKSLIRKEPVHAPFYQKNHPSKSLVLTQTIFKTFHQIGKNRNQRPIITIIPFSSDFDYFRANGKWCYEELTKFMDTNGIEYLNLGEKIEAVLQGKDQSYLYAGEGHFNANGDKLISQIIDQYLKSKEIL